MQKYLSIPVKNEQNQLVLVNDIALIEQAAVDKVEILYTSGKKVEVNHDTMAANNEEVRDRLEDHVVACLQQSWTNVTNQVTFSGITDAAGGEVEVTSLSFA
tara:strand:- start:5161 stop:5466 length:306 start_codon:yes stop_codon:yes gene_type:complete